MSLHRVLLLPLCVGLALPGAGQVPEYELKAEFLERFTRFIDWPVSVSEADPTPFVIGVFGRNPFGPYLERLAATQRIKGRSVKIEIVTDLDEITGCQLLFVPSTEARSLPRILARTRARPILTVSDTKGSAETGVIINFYPAGETLRFEINEAAAERSGLRISSKLLQLARVVRAEGR